MKRLVSILDVKTTLPRLVHPDLEGGALVESVIACTGRPPARPFPLPTASIDRARRIGVAKGRSEVPDDIDVRSAEVARLFARTS